MLTLTHNNGNIYHLLWRSGTKLQLHTAETSISVSFVLQWSSTGSTILRCDWLVLPRRVPGDWMLSVNRITCLPACSFGIYIYFFYQYKLPYWYFWAKGNGGMQQNTFAYAVYSNATLTKQFYLVIQHIPNCIWEGNNTILTQLQLSENLMVSLLLTNKNKMIIQYPGVTSGNSTLKLSQKYCQPVIMFIF